MKKTLIKTKEFLIWTLKMQAGERKKFRYQETNRGLTDHGPLTLNAISVFVSGKFQTIRHNRPPITHKPGTGGAKYLDADSWLNHSLVCLEDGEYHCITPIGTPKFWDRYVFSLKAGEKRSIGADAHVYIASGELVGTEKRILNSWYNWTAQAETDAILVVMYEPTLST